MHNSTCIMLEITQKANFVFQRELLNYHLNKNIHIYFVFITENSINAPRMRMNGFVCLILDSAAINWSKSLSPIYIIYPVCIGLIKSLMVPRLRTSLHDKPFSISTPKYWNSLPTYIKKHNLRILLNKYKMRLVKSALNSPPPPPQNMFSPLMHVALWC